MAKNEQPKAPRLFLPLFVGVSKGQKNLVVLNLVVCNFYAKALFCAIVRTLLRSFARSFEKGLADRGGWREEILQRPWIQASLGTFPENFFGSFWEFVCRQPPPANPFLKPLILCSFALFCGFTFALFCGHLRSFALILRVSASNRV